MAVDAELKALMLQSITVKPRTAQNSYAEATYGTAVTRTCRIEQTKRLVRDAAGQEVVSSTQVYLDDVYSTAVTSEVTLPDGTKPDIITVDVHYDEVGPSHEVLYLA